MLLLWAQLVTGSWSKKAEEAGKYANSNIVAKGDNRSIPARNTWKLSPGAKYVHYCDNETIQVRWPKLLGRTLRLPSSRLGAQLKGIMRLQRRECI